MAALPFEIKDGVDHVLDDLGAGDLPVFCDMADQHQRRAAPLGITDERRGAAAKLRDGAGSGFEPLGP